MSKLCICCFLFSPESPLSVIVLWCKVYNTTQGVVVENNVINVCLCYTAKSKTLHLLIQYTLDKLATEQCHLVRSAYPVHQLHCSLQNNLIIH